jgi:chemotaxis protein methyltransferase CheR
MDPLKQSFASTRLNKRMRVLSLKDLDAYSAYALLNQNELRLCIEALVTHHTRFFREDEHFEKLSSQLLVDTAGVIKLWCAACSSGEEAYTLAIILDQWSRKGTERRYVIQASDISEQAVSVARAGIYRQSALALPQTDWLAKYFQKGTGSQLGKCRVKAEFRAKINFHSHNLLTPAVEKIARDGPYDVIFCRNVLIYFEKSTQQAVIGNLLSCLKPGGHLIVGMAEHVDIQVQKVTSLGSGVYKKM